MAYPEATGFEFTVINLSGVTPELTDDGILYAKLTVKYETAQDSFSESNGVRWEHGTVNGIDQVQWVIQYGTGIIHWYLHDAGENLWAIRFTTDPQHNNVVAQTTTFYCDPTDPVDNYYNGQVEATGSITGTIDISLSLSPGYQPSGGIVLYGHHVIELYKDQARSQLIAAPTYGFDYGSGRNTIFYDMIGNGNSISGTLEPVIDDTSIEFPITTIRFFDPAPIVIPDVVLRESPYNTFLPKIQSIAMAAIRVDMESTLNKKLNWVRIFRNIFKRSTAIVD